MEGGGNRGTRRKLEMTSFRKCHILKPQKFTPQPRLEPAFQHRWRALARKSDLLIITPRVAPTRFTLVQSSVEGRGRAARKTAVPTEAYHYSAM